MKLIRSVVLVGLVGVLGSAVLASSAFAAHANFGPFYKTGGARIAANQEIEAVQSGNQVLKAGTITVTCTALKVKTGATGVLVPAVGENGDTSKETIEYSGCSVTGNGTPCAVTGGAVTTNPLINETGFASKTAGGEGAGKILTLFHPETGTTFATLNFTGAACSVTTTAVKVKSGCTPACEGVIAEDLVENEVAKTFGNVEVNVNEIESKTGQIKLPATEIKEIWIERAGVLALHKAGLEAFAVKATIEGNSNVKLKSAAKWGVATK
jgi:hypothetical protein